jgi:hypothetical protein
VGQHQLAAATELDGEPVGEGDGGPGQPGDGVRLLEQPGHAAVLGVPVLSAALVDQGLRLLVGDDLGGAERARTEHADRVVVAQHQVADGFVGAFTQAVQPPAGRHGRGPSLEADEEVLPLDGAHVRVTLGGEGVDPVRQLDEGLLLGGGVPARRKRLGHGHTLSRERYWRKPLVPREPRPNCSRTSRHAELLRETADRPRWSVTCPQGGCRDTKTVGAAR